MNLKAKVLFSRQLCYIRQTAPPHNEKNNSYQFKELMAPPQLKRVHSSLLDQLARYIGAESLTTARREAQDLEKFVILYETARHQANKY